jgi:acetyl esterase/lipase
MNRMVLTGAPIMLAFVWAAGPAQAQVPADIEAGLRKIGQIVDPACTAKLYRPLMPKNDFNTYWPPDAPAPTFTGQLYPGVTIARDQSFGPNPKDVVDIFTPDKGGGNRPIFIYIPGGAGNKIEQQAREANAFYDNIGRWAVRNGMVGVTIQRHPGANWDDPGRDIANAVDFIKANAARYKGNPNRIFIAAHSAGNGPLGVYLGHAARWKNGVQVKGAVSISGIELAPGVAALTAGSGGRGGGRGGGNALGGAGTACGLTNALGNEGAISGPSGAASAGATPAAPRAGGAPGAPGGRGQLTPEQQAERDVIPGLKKSPVRLMLVRAELDPGVTGGMTATDKAVHDELCKVDGPAAKDGAGHCPTLLYLKDHSHVSEVFAFDTPDQTFSRPLLEWMRKTK